MTIVDVEVGALNPAPYNPRRMTERQVKDLRASIERFGLVDPLVVNEHPGRENVVIGGHQRLNIARALGIETVPVVYVSLPEDKERELNLRLNRNVGEWDWDALAEFDVPLLRDVGFTDEELAKGFDLDVQTPSQEANEIPDAVAAVTQVGDVWLLGEHRLMCGDSFDAEQRATLLDGALADLVLTDPPFAIYGSSTGIGRDIADDKMVRPFFEQMFRAFHASARTFAHIYVHCDWRSWSPVWEAAKRADIVPKNCLVWDKGHPGMGSMYGNTHEFVGFFAKLPPSQAMASSERRGQRVVAGKANILRFPRVTNSEREHNAAKPVELLEQLIQNSTDKGERVLDLFGGSGSTLVAAERTGRVALVMELEPKWCDVTVARWEKLTGKKAARAEPAPEPPAKN